MLSALARTSIDSITSSNVMPSSTFFLATIMEIMSLRPKGLNIIMVCIMRILASAEMGGDMVLGGWSCFGPVGMGCQPLGSSIFL